jgi:FkbM family methyltransferase
MKLYKKHLLLLYAYIALAHHLHAAYPDSFVEDGVIVNELKTEEYIEIIRPFLPENPLILEAGCHGGQDTVLLGQAWPNGIIYAFEPVEKFVEFTLHELNKHRIYNAIVFPYALAPKSGKQTFHYSTNLGAASSLLPSNEALDEICNYKDTQMVVEALNLDEWAEKVNVSHIDFMWLDMEGSEYYVLSSAPNVLKTARAIITEVNFLEFRKGGTQFKELNAFLTNNGFKLFKIWGSPTWQGNALYIKNSLIS